MRMLLVTQDFAPRFGGIETYSDELARRFSKSCDDFAVIAPGGPGTAEIDAALPYRVIRCGSGSDTLPLTSFRQILARTRSGEFDTVFHAQWQTAGASITAGKLPSGGPRRMFIAAHGRELLLAPLTKVPFAQRAYDRIRTRVLNAAHQLFPVSRYTGELLVECGARDDTITVVSNGTDPEHYCPMDVSALRAELGLEGKPVLLSAGRLARRKGLDTVIAALPLVARAIPEVAYVVVGDGDDRRRLQGLAERIGVSDRVHFVGRVPFDDLPCYYNLADVFVTPSRIERPSVEGFGLVFLEANACGKPVIGARSGGIPDAIEDGVTGYMITPDDVPEFAERAVALLSDPELCARMGDAGRRRVLDGFTWDRVHDRILAGMQATG